MPAQIDETETARLKRENALLRGVSSTFKNDHTILDGKSNALSALISHGAKVFRDAKEGRSHSVEVNAPEDIKYMHENNNFNRVVHVFHKEWIGIRAAAGSLPGNKIAISAKTKLHRSDSASFFAALNELKSDRYVFHGMSDNAVQLVGELARSGLSRHVYLVYHGNVSQWCYRPERDLAFSAIELVRTGQAQRIHFMKKNYGMVEGKSFLPMLLNMYPIVKNLGIGKVRTTGTVLVPGTDDWRKNLHCNALGAALSEKISDVVHFARNVVLPQPHARKLKHVHFVDRNATFDLMALCGCVLNVSLVECHPMVNLESEAVGTPCLRGPLNLDAMEDHAYVKLVSVADPTNPFEIRDVLNRAISISPQELREMLADYIQSINRISLERYCEFLEI